MVKFFKSDKQIIEESDKQIIEEKVRSLTLLAIHLELQNDRSKEICKIDLVRAIIKDYDSIMNCLWHLVEPEKKGTYEIKKDVKQDV